LAPLHALLPEHDAHTKDVKDQQEHAAQSEAPVLDVQPEQHEKGGKPGQEEC